MAVWGYFGDPPVPTFVGEVCSMALFLVGIPIGISTRNWNHLDKLIPIGLGLVGIPVVLAGMVAAKELSSPEDLKAGLVYTASVILIPSTFYILMLKRLRSKLRSIVVTAAFLVYSVSQFLFAKRAPLVRVFVVFAFAFWIIPRWTRQRLVAQRAAGMLLIGIVVAMGAAITGGEGWDSTVERFEKLTALRSVIANPLNPETWGDSQSESEVFRFQEVGFFYSDMTAAEKLLGSGLGSYTKAPMLIQDWTVDISEEGGPIAGKSTTHIGMFWAFFKGGAPYFLIFYIGILFALGGLNRILGDPLKLNAWVFVFIHLIFSLFEGFWMAPGVELTTFLVGASVGVLIAEPRL
jgi:hypothetical protein